ncbi:MAG: hypothetical protein CL561_13230 [Alphaproteobacteria bacterium]|nr:hypothetical protein [Alphaproteobacteria bacterium]|tara:strand:+ start:78977 stop:80041 length:1065 start_codon:yes stop_codon:yes gene_type:complete
MKRIIVSMDGTWQTGEQDNPTNIKLIHDCIAPYDQSGTPQLAQHFDGTGTKGNKLKRVFSGITGGDIEDRIKEAYKFVVENYEDGDEVVFSGFSRGAFTARTLNGMIYKSGIIDPSKVDDIDQAIEDAYDFYQSDHRPNSKAGIAFRDKYAQTTRPKTILACFDTVGSLGIPAQLKTLANIFNRDHAFHDTQVNRNTTHAFHIAAIDEQRKNFPLTPMHASDKADTQIMQLWCVGNHSAIGGGSDNNKHKPLSDIAGLKMIDLLQRHCGLGFDAEKMKENFQPNIHINPRSDFKQSGAMWKLFGINTRRIINLGEQFDETVGIRWKHNHLYRPKELNKFSDQDNNFPLCRLPKP